jgi:hypothetical protein
VEPTKPASGGGGDGSHDAGRDPPGACGATHPVGVTTDPAVLVGFVKHDEIQCKVSAVASPASSGLDSRAGGVCGRDRANCARRLR